jgi:hypothetical protein
VYNEIYRKIRLACGTEVAHCVTEFGREQGANHGLAQSEQ